MKRICSVIAVAVMTLTLLSGCGGSKKSIVFADAGWDSIQFHNAVAGFIATAAYGYDEWSQTTGSTPVMHEALTKGEVDVHMEVWTDNIPAYYPDLEGGKFQELGVNFDDNMQGLYVPRYVIEGDSSRGIAPMAPDLKTVEDLKNYKDVFPDPEKNERGRIYGAIPGWEVDTIMYNKYLYYGLDADFEYFRPGSDPALSTALVSAYDKGEAIVGYYWEPTWLMGKYDFVLLEDAPYNADDYLEGKTACPAVKVTVAASNDFAAKNAEFCDFLRSYRTSSQLTSDALAYMQESGASHEEAAKWFLAEHDELIDQFLPADKAKLVRDALK